MRWLLAVATIVLLTGSLLDVRGSSRPRGPAAVHVRPELQRIPMRPPQFILVSFDGSGGARLWQYWRTTTP